MVGVGRTDCSGRRAASLCQRAIWPPLPATPQARGRLRNHRRGVWFRCRYLWRPLRRDNYSGRWLPRWRRSEEEAIVGVSRRRWCYRSFEAQIASETRRGNNDGAASDHRKSGVEMLIASSKRIPFRSIRFENKKSDTIRTSVRLLAAAVSIDFRRQKKFLAYIREEDRYRTGPIGNEVKLNARAWWIERRQNMVRCTMRVDEAIAVRVAGKQTINWQ